MLHRARPTLLPTLLTHLGITAAAFVIAFSLPSISQYILFTWWPLVQSKTYLLVATEITLACGVAAILFLIRAAITNARYVASARLAALVHACEGAGRRWLEDALLESLPAARDLSVLEITGNERFARPGRLMQRLLDRTGEIRVLLLHPGGCTAEHVLRRAAFGLGSVAEWQEQLSATIDVLRQLQSRGKRVRLKFYDHEPFWRLTLHGSHVWVRYCPPSESLEDCPEYVFALQPSAPHKGLFVPFHAHFLNQWDRPEHPEYDFESDQLVYRGTEGRELRRCSIEARLAEASRGTGRSGYHHGPDGGEPGESEQRFRHSVG